METPLEIFWAKAGGKERWEIPSDNPSLQAFVFTVTAEGTIKRSSSQHYLTIYIADRKPVQNFRKLNGFKQILIFPRNSTLIEVKIKYIPFMKINQNKDVYPKTSLVPLFIYNLMILVRYKDIHI